jgi:hypothetical protein
MDNPRFYKFSGVLDIKGPLLGLLFVILSSVPLAFIYSYAARYIPIIYIAWIFSLGYVAGVALAYAYGESFGRNRNKTISFIFILLSFVICLYVSYAAFLAVLSKHTLGFFDLLLDPLFLRDEVISLIETGWFNIKGSRVNGMFYGILLLIEAIGYLIVFLVMFFSALFNRIFCEQCNDWVESEAVPFLISTNIKEGLIRSQKTGEIDWISSINLTDKAPFLTFEISQCKKCNDLIVFKAIETTVTLDDKGETETNLNDLIEFFKLTPHERDEIYETLENLKIISEPQIPQPE